MAILPILEVPDPRLKTVSKPVEAVTDETRKLIADMFETMYDAPGIGLAAIQVGVPQRILVIDLQDEEDADGKPIRDPRVFINPEIVETDEAMNIYTEGCLSVPEQFADVERPATCLARWTDEDGNAHEERLDGLLDEAEVEAGAAWAWLGVTMLTACMRSPSGRASSPSSMAFCSERTSRGRAATA